MAIVAGVPVKDYIGGSFSYAPRVNVGDVTAPPHDQFFSGDGYPAKGSNMTSSYCCSPVDSAQHCRFDASTLTSASDIIRPIPVMGSSPFAPPLPPRVGTSLPQQSVPSNFASPATPRFNVAGGVQDASKRRTLGTLTSDVPIGSSVQRLSASRDALSEAAFNIDGVLRQISEMSS